MLPRVMYNELVEAVGVDNFSEDPEVLDGYAFQSFHKVEPGVWIDRPEAVVLPSSTEEVQEVVKICNKYKVRFKAHSTGFGAMGGPGSENVLQIDLRRMNHILEINEKDQYVVVEPYVICAQIQAEVMKRGLNLHIIGAGSETSALASCTSHIGMGWTGVYTGFNGRNILGAEWVLPSGELLRVGSFGSDCGWICGDGPGPSLRSIMRGWAGADGGLGVFTKCAVKLYNWTGPSQPEVKGTAFDVEVEVPEHVGQYMCIFPSYERWADASYKIGEAEIGFVHCKNAIGAFIAVLVPRAYRKLVKHPNLRQAVKSMQHMFNFMIMANSPADFAYQEATLKQIISECEGTLIDVGRLPALHSAFWWGFVRVSIPPMIFRTGGYFFTAFGTDDTVDSGTQQARHGEEIKKRFIEDGAILDDFTDNQWGGLFENGLISHAEELCIYDGRDPKQSGRVAEFAEAFAQATIEHSLGGVGFAFFAGKEAHDKFGPVTSNYPKWQRQIKGMLDQDDLSDSKYYIEPGEPG